MNEFETISEPSSKKGASDVFLKYERINETPSSRWRNN